MSTERPVHRRLLRAVGEFLGEMAFEAVVTVVSCLLVGSMALLVAWGWSRSPALAGGLVGIFVAFLGYGAWVIIRPSARGRGGRLAVAAAATFTVTAVVIAYAWSCSC